MNCSRKEVSNMSLNLVIGTVIVVMVIFAIFFYGAHKADKAVAVKAAARMESLKKTAAKTKKA